MVLMNALSLLHTTWCTIQTRPHPTCRVWAAGLSRDGFSFVPDVIYFVFCYVLGPGRGGFVVFSTWPVSKSNQLRVICFEGSAASGCLAHIAIDSLYFDTFGPAHSPVLLFRAAVDPIITACPTTSLIHLCHINTILRASSQLPTSLCAADSSCQGNGQVSAQQQQQRDTVDTVAARAGWSTRRCWVWFTCETSIVTMTHPAGSLQ